MGTARRPPAPHTCIGAQQQSHVARRRGRAQPDGRGAPQAAPAARPPWEWPGRRPGAGRGGFFTNCRILVLPPTIGEHANDPRAFSLWGWRERSEQPAPKGKRKGVVCVRAKGGGKTRKGNPVRGLDEAQLVNTGCILESASRGTHPSRGGLEMGGFCMLFREVPPHCGGAAFRMHIPALPEVFPGRRRRFFRGRTRSAACPWAPEAAKYIFRGHSDWEYAGDWGNAGGPFPAPPGAVLAQCANIFFAFPRFLSHSLCITRRNSLSARKWIF